jgi:hypothetical protein
MVQQLSLPSIIPDVKIEKVITNPIEVQFLYKKMHSQTLFGRLISKLPIFKKHFQLHGQTIKSSLAPDPTQIIWENVGVNIRDKLRVRAISLCATFILLSVGFGLIIFLYWAQVN